MEENKKHYGRYVALILLLIVAFVVSWLYFKWKPIYQDAQILEDNFQLNRICFDAKLSVSRDFYEKRDLDGLKKLMELEGVSSEDIYRLKIKGELNRRVLHLNVCKNTSEENDAYMETYLTPYFCSINGAMIYNSVRSNLIGSNALLNALVPTWKSQEYVTFDQLEELFDLDLSKVESMVPSKSFPQYNKWDYFILLLFLDRDEEGYYKEFDGMTFNLVIPEDLEESDIYARITMDRPEEAMKDLVSKAKKYKIPFNGMDLEGLEKIDVTAYPYIGLQVMPKEEEYVDQEIIDELKAVKQYIGF